MTLFKKHPALLSGVVITLVFLMLQIFGIPFLDALELRFYDVRMNFRNVGGSMDEIVLVDIDDDSIEKIGRWPWPRSQIARGVEALAAAGPKVIGLNVIFSEPEDNSGLQKMKLLTDIIQTQIGSADDRILRIIRDAQREMDNDRKLETALKTAGNVVLPVFAKESKVLSEAKKATTKALIVESLRDVQNLENEVELPMATAITTPIPALMAVASGLGHVNIALDLDGGVRRDLLIFRYRDLFIPSFPLKLAARFLNVGDADIRAVLGEAVVLGDVGAIPTTKRTELLVSFKGAEGSFKRFSFFDVVENKIPMDVFKDKIVLITPSAAGILNPVNTPTGQRMSIGEFTANAIWTILNKQFIQQPSWDRWLGIGLILVTGLLVSLVLPRLKAVFSGIAFLCLAFLLVGGSIYLFTSRGLWVQITYPFLQLLLGYIGVVTINFFVTESGKERVEGESAETNRMLGLSFQSQGMLDMAFDKFRKVPVDDQTKDLLYNLALDYERKRQYNKAAAVYEYIERHDPDYKNVSERKEKLVKASETMVFGDGFLTGGGSGDPLLSGGSDTRPTLGRYEILRHLGKGAMGIVYLGQDPRINRTTAIKTFRFTEDFEPEEAEKLKEKFFREAESAGTLSHPNIVTIYDAGDDHDLAYIAMEYLDGEDLSKYTKKKNLLPMRKVIDYVADIAEGLDYAHEKGIVHRDIKPANIMILKTGIIKITDFGIARITATSQTQTGVVKGTPHYMSPEQISGKKVDGRTDIFSLGAMLFQLLTGELPFRGDSPAALMHQIMNVQHPDPRKFNPGIVTPLVSIINKALEKNRNKRYQKAGLMAKHLRQLGAKIDAVMAQKRKAANR